MNIFWLAIKEVRSVLSDKVLVLFVLYAFTWTIYQQASGTSNEVNNASIAFADEDQSALSEELINAFYPPRFQHPMRIRTDEIERSMDEGRFMFVVVIPPQFERNLKAGRQPDIQVNIDATAMQQAGIGAGYIHNIITQRLSTDFAYNEWYGVPRSTLDAAADVALILTFSGALSLKRLLPHAMTLFIIPSCAETAATRVADRHSPNEQARIANYEIEVAAARHFDHVILNLDFDQALHQLESVVNSRRQAQLARPDSIETLHHSI